MTTRAKRFEYLVKVDDEQITADGGSPLHPDEAWTPEHLLLAGLARCTMASLASSAKRAGAAVTGSAVATGAVTRREEDGRFALVEANVQVTVALDPPPEDISQVLYYAERGCFVGASLTATPTYEWIVNGTKIT